MKILPLTGSHDRKGFDCGRGELNGWLQQTARQHQDKGISKTFVAVLEDDPTRIYGYYALTLAELDAGVLPDAWKNRLPRRVPGIRLGRLAVAFQVQGKGLGSFLLVDALTRAQRIQTEAGGIGMLVDALDAQAAAFYRHFGFESCPDQPLLMFLPAKLWR
ncbi:MAG: N-acetyltransferase [Alphaproteobacteria bacterium CG_4_10_14_0_2_um_filter_63_37]|nr:MAG: GNAT family N-acetyltransferase [Proteobacteria bacterium CG1_02_64_396]PJA24635.1 MAG: N-acetyltransferase [Alphaproteobacteria bacterium CG_4_10_14_0_2_um_filter_63_37]